MSYNITNWKTLKLEGFKILFSEVEELEETIWQENGKIFVELGEDNGVEGTLVTDQDGIEWLVVKSVELSGSFSRTGYGLLLDCLETSKGKLIAIVTWEGGDAVNVLCCNNGKFTEISFDRIIEDFLEKYLDLLWKK